MSISCIYGKPGSGKSCFATFYAFALAEKCKKSLVFNYALQPLKLAYYFKLMNYTWLSENISKGAISYFSLDDSLEKLLSIPNSIVVCDEAAIYFPARSSAGSTPKKVLKDLVQIRHRSQFLIIISQSPQQIDIAIRSLSDETFYADGKSFWNAKLNNKELIWKQVNRFESPNFDQWFADPKLRKNPLKTRILANKNWSGVPSVSDKFIFSLYNSFNILGSGSESKSLSFSGLLSYQLLGSCYSISGRNPFKFHRFSWISRLFFVWLPADFHDTVVKLDIFLLKLPIFSKLERRIIYCLLGFLIFGAIHL